MTKLGGRELKQGVAELADRMMSAAGWHPDDCRFDDRDGILRVTNLITGEIRQWDKERDKHPDRDLAVAP